MIGILIYAFGCDSPVPNAIFAQVSITTFSQTGVHRRGDTRDWTETPSQKLMRLTAAANGSEPAIMPAPGGESAAAALNTAAVAHTVDSYNAGARRKTLVEVHQERISAEKKVRALGCC